ncbi:MAG: SDR family NAD(P)-dependent oxidoreductase, partial [Bdellovibrio sp.]|nr:SDR family NAD(P)-dependent oxidoreductase [Bdellovibrio sp.]
RGARIVNIASIGGLVPVPHLAPYCTGKFALVGYSQTLRAELMRKGIYVTTACPGLMRTGSIDHAKFKGQIKKEYAWFSAISSMPLITTSAERAARQIVDATKIGQAEVTVQVSTKIAAIMQAHFPDLFSDFIALANLVLPGPGAPNNPAVEGKDAHSAVSPSVITTLSQRAATRNNERPDA